MARAISPYARYTIQLVESPVKRGTDASGTVVEFQDSKPVIAEFEKQGLHPWEQVAALEAFAFGGLAETVNPLSVLSVYDTEAAALNNGWTPEFHAKMDARLRQLAERNPSNFIVVDKPRTPAPWPAYDEQSVEEILSTIAITKTDPDDVRLYEVENLNRAEVIDAMEHYGDPMIERELSQEEIDSFKAQAQRADGNLGSGITQGRASQVLPQEVEVVA